MDERKWVGMEREVMEGRDEVMGEFRLGMRKCVFDKVEEVLL